MSPLLCFVYPRLRYLLVGGLYLDATGFDIDHVCICSRSQSALPYRYPGNAASSVVCIRIRRRARVATSASSVLLRTSIGAMRLMPSSMAWHTSRLPLCALRSFFSLAIRTSTSRLVSRPASAEFSAQALRSRHNIGNCSFSWLGAWWRRRVLQLEANAR